MKQYLLDFSNSQNHTISLNELEIKKWFGKKEVINDFLEKHHYLGKVAGYKFCYVIFYQSNLIGVATLGRPVARQEDSQYTLELTRFCMSVRIQNAVTYILSKIIKDIKRNTQYKRIIAYTDLSKHYGTVYKASNFKLVKTYQKKGKAWLNRSNRNCTYGNTPKAKYELIIA